MKSTRGEGRGAGQQQRQARELWRPHSLRGVLTGVLIARVRSREDATARAAQAASSATGAARSQAQPMVHPRRALHELTTPAAQRRIHRDAGASIHVGCELLWTGRRRGTKTGSKGRGGSRNGRGARRAWPEKQDKGNGYGLEYRARHACVAAAAARPAVHSRAS